jgi:stage II sporulation protein D
MRRLLPIILLFALPASASADERLVVKGGGFGHGVGMSQYGAMGQAKLGKGYREILGHYYSETAIAKLSSIPTVRVLLQSRNTVKFTGGRQAADRRLQPAKTYAATVGAGGVTLRSSSGRKLKTFPAPLRVVGPSGLPVQLVGGANNGPYRGALELRPAALGGLNVINALDLENYVRGVVSRESPSSWPGEALKAQAVAARTYAITTSKSGDGFDQYPDTRSQVYGGVTAETPATDAAVAATRNEVVTHGGRPVTTFFFSTSGGRTENYEFGFVGGLPKPWLKSVEDPYDNVSPKHRWDFRFTPSQAKSKLGSLVKGSLKEIKVIQRGVSPRVVKAEVVGTNGTTEVDGPTLRRKFGLYDTWAYFTMVGAEASADEEQPVGGEEAAGGYSAVFGTARRGTISGRVRPAKRGTQVLIQRRTAVGQWLTETRTHVGRRGRYRTRVSRTGAYRAIVHGMASDPVKLK